MNGKRFREAVQIMDDATIATADFEISNDPLMEKIIQNRKQDIKIDQEIDATISGVDDRAEIIKLQKKLNKLEGNKSVTAGNTKKEIKAQITEIQDKYKDSEVDVTIKQRQEAVAKAVDTKFEENFNKYYKGAKKAAKDLGFKSTQGPKIYKTTKGFISAIAKAENLSFEEAQEKAKGADGVFLGEGIMFIDKQKAKEVGAITGASHELLHPVFNAAIGDAKAQGKIVREFKKAMTSKQKRFVRNKLKANVDPKNWNTEYLTYFSDAILKGEINYDKNLFEKLKDVVLRVLKGAGFDNASFDSGREVYNFLKEYNTSLKETGQVSEKAVEAIKAAEQAKGIKVADVGRVGDVQKSVNQEILDLTDALDAAEDAYAADPNNPTLEKNVELAEKALDEAEERAISGAPKPKVVTPKPKKEVKKEVKKEDKPKVKKETTSKQKELNEKVDKLAGKKDEDGNYIMSKKEWDRTGIGKASQSIIYGDILNPLITRGITGEGVQGKSLQDFTQAVKDELLPVLMNFNPEKNNSLIGWINSQLRFKKGNVLKRFKKEADLGGKSLDVEAGETGFAGNISGDAGVIRNFADEKQIAPDKLVKASKVITPKVRADLANMLKKWASQNNIDFDIFRFGDVDANATVKIDGKNVKVLNEVLKELFPGVDPEKFLDSRTMFTSGEASTVLSKLAENDQELIELFINLLPRGAVMPKGKNKAIVKDDNYGKSTKLDGSILKNFYDKGTERFTKKAGLTPFILKDNIRYSDVHKAFGMDSSGNKLNYQRAKSGIVLSSAYKMLGKLIMNEVIRTDLGLTAEQKMNVGAGKSDLQFSFTNTKISKGLESVGIKIDPNLSQDDLRAQGRRIFIEIANILGPEKTAKYLVPIVSKSSFKWTTIKGKKELVPRKSAIFKGREDFFNELPEIFNNYIPGSRTISTVKKDKNGNEIEITLAIPFSQVFKNPVKFIKQIKQRQKFAEDQRKGLFEISKELIKLLETPGNEAGVAMFLSYMNTNVNGLIRTAAIPKKMFLIPPSLDGKPVKYRYEHSQTASDTLVELSQLIFDKLSTKNKFGKNPEFKKEFDDIMEGFIVSIIPVKYDRILTKFSAFNGERIDTDSRSDYFAKLKKPSEDGIPTRYLMPDFLKAVNDKRRNLMPMDVVDITEENLKAFESSFEFQPSINAIETTETLNKANNNANNVNAKPKGISVWDFDDTLAKTKSNVLYTMPGEIRIFHGGDIKSVKDIDGFVYFSEDKKQAAAYAKGNQGEISSFKIDEASIATEDQVFDVINNLDIKPRAGYAVDESNLYELIDPRFEQSFSKKDLEKLAVALKRKGIKAARFTDTNISPGKNEGRETENVVVFDKKVVQEQNKLDAEQFAKEGDKLMAEGADFDFSEFSKVVNGSKGPFFEKAMARNKKFGNKNVFILTARPANSANAIHEFLKGIGLDIPLENITGLANSSPQAKADWIVGKAAEGYNDFYFADDAIQNVKAVAKALEVLDVKSKVRQANVQFSKSMNSEFNQMIEKKSGIDARGTISKYKASVMGRKKGRFQFFIPPGAEDFEGLMYKLLDKGKLGEQQKEWFKKALFDPFARGINEFDTYKLQVANAVRQLKKSLKDIPKELGKRDPKTDFKYEDAVRVYLWQLNRHEIKGISESDIKTLVDIVKNSPNLKRFARQLNKTMGGYPAPQESWLAGTITTDAINMVNTIKRKEFLETWQQNADIIFSEDNLNKLEATFGEDYVEALKDSLYRMKSGRNRPVGANKLTNKFMNWVNDSVATIMFFNTRSALLQTLSTVNFINWGDNNPLLAAKAFGNQKQFWSDFSMLFNSDFLKSRRTGLKNDVNADEIANAAATQTNKAKAALAVILKAGFLPTQIADSFAIAMGGASFYRNRVNTYMQKGEGKPGMGRLAAEEQAFLDFQEIAEATQQSSRPDRVSQQQASPLGRIILAFANTPMQYMRLTKKAFLDLKNGRGSAKENITKMLYYAAIQNVIFSSLQAALFAVMFDDEEEEETKKKGVRVANTMLDSMLRGLGIYGAVASTVKNIALEIDKQSKKDRPDYAEAAVRALDLSPPISSKIRKGRSAGRAFSYKNTREKMVGFGLDNPAYYAVGQIASATANIPLDRAVRKANHVRLAFAQETKFWQSVSLLLGFSEWDLNMIEKNKKKTKFGEKMKWKKRKWKER